MLIRPYQSGDQQAVEAYYLREEAKPFTRSPQEALAYGLSCETYRPFLCFEGEVLVASFVLDGGEDRLIYTDKANSLLLRSFSVDSRFEGQGHAKAVLAQLSDLMHQYFPHIKEVVLGVNADNKRAINLYSHNGFEDTGDIYQGPKGAQQIFILKI